MSILHPEPDMNEAKTPYFDEYGCIRSDPSLLSILLNRYPRKIGPILDQIFDLRLAATGISSRIKCAAELFPPIRNVLIVGIEVPSRPEFMAHVRATLPSSRHIVNFSSKVMEPGRAKFDNLNDLLRESLTDSIDWLIVTDDDIAVPSDFLNRFIYLLEKFDFKIGQPAHNLRSYATYLITRRHWRTIARRTNFVEIGPLVALHRETFPDIIPFPSVGMGWGLDNHWAYLAREKGWPIGVIDALPIQHLRPTGSGYNADKARMEGERFLETHRGLTPREALKTVTEMRSI